MEKIENLMACICEELCRHPREAVDQEELDGICAECLVGEYRYWLLSQADQGSVCVRSAGKGSAEMKEIMIKFIVNYFKENQFYPSYDEIAKGVGRVKSTIHEHMKKLEEEGVIVRKTDYSSQYRLINMGFILAHETAADSFCKAESVGSR